MIKLTVDPQVLAALQADFPKPANSARRALDKYLQRLEKMLFQAFLVGLTPRQRKLKLYPLSLSILWDQGGQIGPKRLRLHKWLSDNDFTLAKTVELGSNLSGLVSEVKLSPWVKMTNTLDIPPSRLTATTSDADIDVYLDGDQASNLAVFSLLYPDFQSHWTAEDLYSRFDRVDVDVKSLKSYIVWLSTEAKLISAAKKAHAIRQARLILSVTRVLGGAYLQRKKPSDFGRMYYEGVSVQNVNKELRRAMLGNCWEYDIRSSVIAWKMGYARSYLTSCEPGAELRRVFSATLTYLEDKADFMATVRHYVFDQDSATPKDLQNKLLKQAFTAISFGARQTTHGWQDASGGWNNPALVTILKNPEERQRFMDDVTVKAFIREQNKLDNFLYDQVRANWPQLLALKCVQTEKGQVSKPKVLAYLYQHGETEVMNIVRNVAAQQGRAPIANVHDAIFFKRKLSVDAKSEIEWQMREQTGNPYWHLTASELKRFESRHYDERQEELAHKWRIEKEHEKAQFYAAKLAAIGGHSWAASSGEES
jgi:hypothetical protein